MTNNLLLMLLLCGVNLLAQTGKGGNTATGSLQSHFPIEGKTVIELNPMDQIPSLDALVRMPLIIKGRVITSLPSLRRDERVPQSVESHSVVAIDRVFKGIVPDGAGVVTVVQEGGTVDRITVEVQEVPLMKVGEEYIFFLVPDDRKLSSNPSGGYRFSIAGGWAGIMKIVEGRVTVSPKSAQPIQAYQNFELDSFLRTLNDFILGRGVPLKKTESRADIPWPIKP